MGNSKGGKYGKNGNKGKQDKVKGFLLQWTTGGLTDR